MKKSITVQLTSLLLVVLMAVAPSWAFQGSQVHTTASAKATAGLHKSPEQTTITIGPNMVLVQARHCQAYQQEDGSIDSKACGADKSTLFYQHLDHNLVTNAGFTMIEQAISNTAAQPAACNYIAMANDTSNSNVGTVAVTDTTIASSGTGSTEIAANGLTRAQGSFTADSPGAKQYTVSKTFNATGTQASDKTGLFNASSSGTMCYEALYTLVTVNNGDTLTVTWTVTLS
jgi:hypothetical protein